jgi:hypothetical protein
VAVDAMRDVEIQRLTVIDSGGGHGVANAATQRVNASLVALEQVAGAMGLDLEKFLQGAARKVAGDVTPARKESAAKDGA